MDTREIQRRFPPFHITPGFRGVLEREAGFLFVEDCVAAHISEARQAGADIRERESGVSWHAAADRVEVRTTAERYTAARLVLTAGPWAGQLLAEVGRPLRVMRQVMQWFGARDDRQFRRDRFPIYLAEVPEGYFYGLPMIDKLGHKVAQHYGAPELTAPEQVDRVPTEADQTPVRQFLSRYLPDANGPLRKAQVCTYTLTPDRHFILDLHPQHPNVAIAGGFSGHGFKFAPVVGEIMADLVTNGKTDLPIGMFRIGRFG
jgi:sarcosine oxidase